MVTITTKTVRGQYVEIEQRGGRGGGKYLVRVNDAVTGEARTIVKAKRMANSVLGFRLFDIDGAHVHA